MMTIAKGLPHCRRTSASSAPVSRRRGIERHQDKRMPPCGAILVPECRDSIAAFADHDAVAVAMMPPATVPAIVAMHAILRPRAFPVVMVAAALDHDGLRACNRRRCDGNRTKRRDDVTQLLHVVLLTNSGS